MVHGIYGMAEAAAELTIAAAFFIELCGREKVTPDSIYNPQKEKFTL